MKGSRATDVLNHQTVKDGWEKQALILSLFHSAINFGETLGYTYIGVAELLTSRVIATGICIAKLKARAGYSIAFSIVRIVCDDAAQTRV